MRRLLMLTVVFACVNPSWVEAQVIYGFDDGTFEGWDYLVPDGSPFPVDDGESSWISSNETIDINDGFDLLSATSGEFRIVPDPWETRDCIGSFCLTTILRSPAFYLDGSGDLTIDMMGGAFVAANAFDPDNEADQERLPTEPEDLPDEKSGEGVQGFALLDVEANSYVAYGFSSRENDGKGRADDPVTRADWETVAIPQDELTPFANDGKQYKVEVFDSFSGGWGWIGFDTVTIPGSLEPGGGTIGDFNGNDALDAEDMDLLSAAVMAASTEAQFDLDGDGSVGNGDRSYWAETLANSTSVTRTWMASSTAATWLPPLRSVNTKTASRATQVGPMATGTATPNSTRLTSLQRFPLADMNLVHVPRRQPYLNQLLLCFCSSGGSLCLAVRVAKANEGPGIC